jgi:hypothetical protein
VGLQPTIPLSRRVQLAVLAHIRHTHTRYDRLLRETTWMNARKAVEPVCLDVLVRWRGDEETGRDQLDEILREVVIITDSEDSDDSSAEDDSSDDEEGNSSASSGGISNPNSRNQMRPAYHDTLAGPSVASMGESMSKKPMDSMVPVPCQATIPLLNPPRQRREHRGFNRYQAAWDQALSRQDPNAAHASSQADNLMTHQRKSDRVSPYHEATHYSLQASPKPRYPNVPQDQAHRQEPSKLMSRQVSPDSLTLPARIIRLPFDRTDVYRTHITHSKT